MLAEENVKTERGDGDLHPAGSAPRQSRHPVRKRSPKAYGDTLLYEDLNFALPPGGIVGIIGPNGAGKTTLFRMITGQEKPDSGTITVGETVKLAYVDQSRPLDPSKTIWEEISGGEELLRLGNAGGELAGLRGPIQFQRHRPAEEDGPALRRGAEPGAPRQDPAGRGRTSCCWTSRRTTWTSTRSGRSRKRLRTSPAAPW